MKMEPGLFQGLILYLVLGRMLFVYRTFVILPDGGQHSKETESWQSQDGVQALLMLPSIRADQENIAQVGDRLLSVFAIDATEKTRT